MQFLEAVDMPTPRAVLVLYRGYFSYIDITVDFIAKVATEISVILNIKVIHLVAMEWQNL